MIVFAIFKIKQFYFSYSFNNQTVRVFGFYCSVNHFRSFLYFFYSLNYVNVKIQHSHPAQ